MRISVGLIDTCAEAALLFGFLFSGMRRVWKRTIEQEAVCDFCARRGLKESMIEHQGHYFCDEAELENLRLRNGKVLVPADRDVVDDIRAGAGDCDCCGGRNTFHQR